MKTLNYNGGVNIYKVYAVNNQNYGMIIISVKISAL